MNIPEIILVGDVELLFLGLAIGAGMPRVAKRVLASRYGPLSSGNAEAECEHEDCPLREEQ